MMLHGGGVDGDDDEDVDGDDNDDEIVDAELQPQGRVQFSDAISSTSSQWEADLRMNLMMTYDDDACDCGEEATQQQGKTFPVELPPSQVLIKGVISDH